MKCRSPASIRAISNALAKAQEELAHLRLCMDSGSKLENLGDRMIELRRLITGWQEMLR
jgi:hypothetical protein